MAAQVEGLSKKIDNLPITRLPLVIYCEVVEGDIVKMIILLLWND